MAGRGVSGRSGKTAQIRLDGSTACWHLPGAMDSEAFVTYASGVLGPSLRPGEIVVMDNLSVHRSPEFAHLVEAVGAGVQFLPSYAPDLNPI